MEKEFWDGRWINQEIHWDVGHASTPLKEYFDQLEDKSVKILIPGAGNSYEAEYLHEEGFGNVYVVDISEHALSSFKNRCPQFPFSHIIQGDFFEVEGAYDLIVEQTFFCAIQPGKRRAYCQQMRKLLNQGGKLIGVLFNFPLESGPPFGGGREEYKDLFETYFEIVEIANCYNSIKPREERELWLKASDGFNYL